MNIIEKIKDYGTPIRIDISRDDEYYTQRNNTKYPYSACNVTSMINWLSANKTPFPIREGIQPEDDLMDLLHTKQAYEEMKKRAPWAIGTWPPNQVWTMMEWGVNEFVGKKICYLDFTATFEKMIFSILTGKAVVVGGQFSGLGHFVTACGIATTQKGITIINIQEEIDVSKITHIIIDDPYGNPLTNYDSHKGNSISIPIKYFLDAVKDYNKKKVIWGFYHTDIK